MSAKFTKPPLIRKVSLTEPPLMNYRDKPWKLQIVIFAQGLVDNPADLYKFMWLNLELFSKDELIAAMLDYLIFKTGKDIYSRKYSKCDQNPNPSVYMCLGDEYYKEVVLKDFLGAEHRFVSYDPENSAKTPNRDKLRRNVMIVRLTETNSKEEKAFWAWILLNLFKKNDRLCEGFPPILLALIAVSLEDVGIDDILKEFATLDPEFQRKIINNVSYIIRNVGAEHVRERRV